MALRSALRMIMQWQLQTDDEKSSSVTWRSLPGEPILARQNFLLFLLRRRPVRLSRYRAQRRYPCDDQIRIAGVCREITCVVPLELTLWFPNDMLIARSRSAVSRQTDKDTAMHARTHARRSSGVRDCAAGWSAAAQSRLSTACRDHRLARRGKDNVGLRPKRITRSLN